MPNIFDQIEEAAQRQGATAQLDEAKKAAVRGAVGLGAMALGQDNVEDLRQTGRNIDDRFGPALREVRDAMPEGVSASVQPMAGTVTPMLDLSVIPGLQGQAQATMGQSGLLGYNVDAQVPVGGGLAGTVNYGPQGGTMGMNYAQDGFSAFVNAPVPERTASVKDLLDKFTFGLQYRKTF